MVRLRGAAVAAVFGAALVLAQAGAALADDQPVEVKLVDQFNAMFGSHAGYRANHAKGIVFEGMFQPSPSAATLSSALHLQKQKSRITIRFSNAGGLPDAPDTHPSALTHGIAIKFHLSDGTETDALGITLNGFPAATADEFLAFLKAAAASGPDAAKPTPIETYLGAHPAAAKILSQPQPTPVNYATAIYYGVNAFKFTNAAGKVQYGRYRFVPVPAAAYVKDVDLPKLAPNALADNLKKSVAKGPVRMKLLVQLAQPGDSTSDATQIWPENRPTVELGEISITSAVADSASVEQALLFTPTNLTPGIDESDDPLIDARAAAYAVSYGRRQ